MLDQAARAVEGVAVLRLRVDAQGVIERRDQVVRVDRVPLRVGPVRGPTRRRPGPAARRRRPPGRCSTTASGRGRRGRRCSSSASRSSASGRTRRPSTTSVDASRPRRSRSSSRADAAWSKTGQRQSLEHREVVAVRVPGAVGAAGRLRVGAGGPVDLHEARARPRPAAARAGSSAQAACGRSGRGRAAVSPSSRKARAVLAEPSSENACRSEPSNPSRLVAGVCDRRRSMRAFSRPSVTSGGSVRVSTSAAAAGRGTSGTGRSGAPRMPRRLARRPVTAPSWIGPQRLTKPRRPRFGRPVAGRDRADRGQVLARRRDRQAGRREVERSGPVISM